MGSGGGGGGGTLGTESGVRGGVPGHFIVLKNVHEIVHDKTVLIYTFFYKKPTLEAEAQHA